MTFKGQALRTEVIDHYLGSLKQTREFRGKFKVARGTIRKRCQNFASIRGGNSNSYIYLPNRRTKFVKTFENVIKILQFYMNS